MPVLLSKIKERGERPYLVVSGDIEWAKSAPEELTAASTFKRALEIVRDISDCGAIGTASIRDSQGKEVFAVKKPADREFLERSRERFICVIPNR